MWGCVNAPFAGFGGRFGILVCLLLLTLLLLMAAKVGRLGASTGGNTVGSKDSLGILKNRLANGEITLDEFNALKRVLH